MDYRPRRLQQCRGSQRAEIGDSSEDRIYTLTFEAADDAGNSTIESAIVVVPVEQLWRHQEAYSGER